jgi:hypothetical protein
MGDLTATHPPGQERAIGGRRIEAEGNRWLADDRKKLRKSMLYATPARP